MGTSVNQRSPDTPNWNIVRNAYDNPDFPIARALREVWRAAGAQGEGTLLNQLADPAIATIGALAAGVSTAAEASQIVGEYVADHQVSSFGTTIATRAAMQSAGRADATEFFLLRLFAEATNYLVSRDLPGHVTPGSRIQNPSDARRFRQEMMRTATDAVQDTSRPATLEGDAWSSFVTSVARTIRRIR